MNKLSFSTLTYVRTSHIIFIFCCLLMTTLEMKAMVASNHATLTSSFVFPKEKRQSFIIEPTSIFAHKKSKKQSGEVATEAVAVVFLLLLALFFIGLFIAAIDCAVPFGLISCKNSALFIGISIVGLFLSILGIRKALRKKKRTS